MTKQVKFQSQTIGLAYSNCPSLLYLSNPEGQVKLGLHLCSCVSVVFAFAFV